MVVVAVVVALALEAVLECAFWESRGDVDAVAAAAVAAVEVESPFLFPPSVVLVLEDTAIVVAVLVVGAVAVFTIAGVL